MQVNLKKMLRRSLLLTIFAGCSAAVSLSAQESTEADIPAKRIALFSSGVGFFEHSGQVKDRVQLSLPFEVEAVDDVLKSLIIHDSGTTAPLLSYPLEDTLLRTLKSLKIDLSGNPGLPEILAGLRGAEIEVFMPEKVSGRIVGLEKRKSLQDNVVVDEPFLSLITEQGVQVLSLKEIASFRFLDPKITADLNRALDLILRSRDTKTRNLLLELPGQGERKVSFAYVVPTPVWKVSYRLDLSDADALLQGWAIVDNASDTDWQNVELSLVTGRPVSFVQNLYRPYYLQRPVLPLAIAGYAEAITFDSGYGRPSQEAAPAEEKRGIQTQKGQFRRDNYHGTSLAASYDGVAGAEEMDMHMPAAAPPSFGLQQSSYDMAQTGTGGGEQFVYTMKRPVNLPRRQSAMLPMVEARPKTRKLSVFSGQKATRGGNHHPVLCAELTNTTGMKLPAGPITIFDGGNYAGDALLNFLPEKEKRLIAFGEDLSVTGTIMNSSSQAVTQVTLVKGTMIVTSKIIYNKKYSLKNSSSTERNLIVEHPITANSTLLAPASFEERTDSLYRFLFTLDADQERSFAVDEEVFRAQHITLANLSIKNLLSYSKSGEIPEKIQKALTRAIELKRQEDEAGKRLVEFSELYKEQLSEQERIRKNLMAAGNETSQGKEYLKRLGEIDRVIDRLNGQRQQARKNAEESRKAYEAYLSGLTV